MTARVEFVAYYHDGHQWRVGLMIRRRRLTVVGNDGRQVRARVLTPAEERNVEPVEGASVPKAKALLRRQGKAFGITKAARLLIRAAKPNRQRALKL